jgi:hypothetical protein
MPIIFCLREIEALLAGPSHKIMGRISTKLDGREAVGCEKRRLKLPRQFLDLEGYNCGLSANKGGRTC